MRLRRWVISGLASVALVAAMLPVAGAATKKPIFFKIKSTVEIDARGFPTPTTYSFEGSTSAGGAGFQLSRCRFGRLVRLHYVNGSGDTVVGTTTSIKQPGSGPQGSWQITAPRPGVPTQVYAEVPKRKVKRGVCQPDSSPQISLTG